MRVSKIGDIFRRFFTSISTANYNLLSNSLTCTNISHRKIIQGRKFAYKSSLRLMFLRAAVAAAGAADEVFRSEGAVQERQLAQLQLAQFVLSVGNLESLVDDLLNLKATATVAPYSPNFFPRKKSFERHRSAKAFCIQVFNFSLQKHRFALRILMI